MIKRLRFLLPLLVFASCEDVIQVSVDQGPPKLVVDAFVSNLPQDQVIRLTRSINYFDSSGSEPGVEGATVLLVDTSNFRIFNFVDQGQGRYVFSPNPAKGDTFTIGRGYTLLIATGSDTLISFSTLRRTTRVDSIVQVPVEGNGPPTITTGCYLDLRANDLPGPGDFWWVKTFRNDTFQNRIDQLNLAADMGNTNNGLDGGMFIYPVRTNISDRTRSFQAGEQVRVEIHSISREAYYWFLLVQNENFNGGLFATPPSNIPTNIVNINPNKKSKLAGFFCMTAAHPFTHVVRE
ncbi:MAG: DUF4249 domain-containing protein [Bacteroidia bacterium]